MEVCHNPLKSECESSDIVVYIQVGTERLPICRQCWGELAESDFEWGEEGLKITEEKASLSQAGQFGVTLENENKATVLAKAQRSRSEAQNEPDAGEKFLEELSKTISSE